MAEKKKMKSEASSSKGNSSTGGGPTYKGETVVADCGRRRSSCGYCKSPGPTSISHGLWAYSLTVDDYQALLDRGWRRSGCFLYKPEMEKTCCPSYTIRLKTSDFKPSKEQQRVSKRMLRFLDGTWDGKRSEGTIAEPNSCKKSCSPSCKDSASLSIEETSAGINKENSKAEHLMLYLSDQIDNAIRACIGSVINLSVAQLPKHSVKKVEPPKRKLLAVGSEDLLFSSNIAFQVTAALKRTKRDADTRANVSQHDIEEPWMFSPVMLAEMVTKHLKESVRSSGLSVRACNGHINFYAADKSDLADIVRTASTAFTSRSDNKDAERSSELPRGRKRTLEIRLRESSFDPEEYELYRIYQLRVHNDPPDHITESSYRRFLVDTPLVFVPPAGDGTTPPCGLGSFHQQYLIDGKLVAVGVIDILPNCLSSKYLFWNPDLAFLSLGKYSALQEIRWVTENQKYCPSLQYYYLGYYIHSCSKMRYKAAYQPSELLCPLRYDWVPFDIAKPLLDQKPYVVLSDFPNLQNGGSPLPRDVESFTEQHQDHFLEGPHDVSFKEDEEMGELDSEDSDDDWDPEETGSVASAEVQDADIGDTVIGLKQSRLRYKDIQYAFGSRERKCMESQLRRYTRAVGTELSKRIVYSLG